MWSAVTSIINGVRQPYLQPSTDDIDASQSPEDDYTAGRSLYEAGNYTKATLYLTRASQHGHAEAMKVTSFSHTSLNPFSFTVPRPLLRHRQTQRRHHQNQMGISTHPSPQRS
ncbi:hypothetical protein BC829DRAFT_221632 [Chytridium lagenaria]|nr:hypothetical protein BC829DRAFT_221632 [Chytridium lagenaria]